MDSANQAVWYSFEITTRRWPQTICSVEHPQFNGRRLFFIADVPHLIQSLKSAFCRYDITTPDGRHSSAKHLKALIAHDESRDLKLAPNLKSNDIDSTYSQKIKASSALHVFSNMFGSSIEFMDRTGLLSAEGQKSALDTAWLNKTINRWFDLMSSRSFVQALSKFDVEKYNKSVSFLRSIITLSQTMQFGQGNWKPVQTGVILAINAILELAKEVLSNKLPFLLTSKLTQDCLENLFLTVRLKTATPSICEFWVGSESCANQLQRVF